MDVFVSYQRNDLEPVRRLVAALRAADLRVWWDQDISPDAPWEATIERQLATAKVVIVAWSRAAVASENVKAEARQARHNGKLIQVFVEACDPPLFFGERQGVDLSRWNGDANTAPFAVLEQAVRAILAGKRPAASVGYLPAPRRWGGLIAAAVFISAALGVVANLGGAKETVCSLTPLSGMCGEIVVANNTPSRTELLNSIEGAWGPQDRDCSDVVRYTVRRDDGVDRIVARAPNYESVGQVIAAEAGVIVSRDTNPSAAGEREQWEFRPDGDRLTVYDKDGVATTLMRCD